MEEHSKLIKENSKKMEKLKEALKTHQDVMTKATYASVAAGRSATEMPGRVALHSVVVTSTDEIETGDEVLNKIRKVVNVTETGIQVERFRKVKNQKIIVGCKWEEERRKVKERLAGAQDHLIVEDIKYKNPLLVL